jgi:hypothetical protein
VCSARRYLLWYRRRCTDAGPSPCRHYATRALTVPTPAQKAPARAARRSVNCARCGTRHYSMPASVAHIEGILRQRRMRQAEQRSDEKRQRSDGERFTICNTSRCRKEFGGAVFSSCMLLQLTKRSGAFRWRVCHVLSCGAPLPIAAGRSW